MPAKTALRSRIENALHIENPRSAAEIAGRLGSVPAATVRVHLCALRKSGVALQIERASGAQVWLRRARFDLSAWPQWAGVRRVG